MKANSLNKPWIKWSILAIYVISVIFLALHHEPWGDEYHVWHMTYSMSLRELISSMRTEGHFCLWHLCVLPWVRIFGMDYHALYVASISLMTIAVWLLLFRVEFSFIGKLFIIFSAPFIYHFPVIARCYALIPPITIGIVTVYQKRKSPFLFCLLVGLLAHTHAYMEGLAAILWILFVYHFVIKIWNMDRKRAEKNLKASMITVALVILAFLQIAGSIVDASNGIGPAFSGPNSDVSWIFYFFSHHRVKIFNTLRLYLWEHIPNFDLSITLLAYMAIVWLVSEVINNHNKERKWSFLLIIVVSIVWQVLFATNIYPMGFQRVYLVCLPVFLILGMGYSSTVRKISAIIVMLFWLVNTPCQYVIAKDITQEYNYDVRCAKELESIIPSDAEIVTTGEVSCIRLMKRQFHYINIVDDNECLLEELSRFIESKPRGVLYLITTETLDSLSLPGFVLKPEYRGIEGNGEISDIQHETIFNLYLIGHEEII